MAFDMAVISGDGLFSYKVGSKEIRERKVSLASFPAATSNAALFSCSAFSDPDFFLKHVILPAC